MQFIQANNRHQTYFTTPEDQVIADKAARLMNAFMDKLDLQKLGFTGTAELQAKLLLWHRCLIEKASSVKGIGKRATATLIVYTQGFVHTASYRQLISYAGLSPGNILAAKVSKGGFDY